MAHTQAPWIVAKHFAERHGGRTYLPVMRPGTDPVPIAVVHRDVDGHGREEGEANARLIAAAPDLLEALQWFINDIDGTHTVMADFDANVARARAAIAKATAA